MPPNAQKTHYDEATCAPMSINRTAKYTSNAISFFHNFFSAEYEPMRGNNVLAKRTPWEQAKSLRRLGVNSPPGKSSGLKLAAPPNLSPLKCVKKT